LGFVVDFLLVLVVWLHVEYAWRHFVLQQADMEMKWDFHEKRNILAALYTGDWPIISEMARRRASGLRARGPCLLRVSDSDHASPWNGHLAMALPCFKVD
jgi:hypothetical protein